jgi:hypothetical protein
MSFLFFKDAEWNIELSKDGPMQSPFDDGMFRVLKEGKAILKGLFANVDQVSSDDGAGKRIPLQHILLLCASV